MKSDTGIVNATKIYSEVYEQENLKAAQVAASRLLAKPEAQRTLADYLAVDYPKHKRSKRLTELADAKKDHVLQDGEIVEIRDNATSIRALELLARVDGDIKDGDTIDARSVHYTVTPDEAEKLGALAEKLASLRAKAQAKRVTLNVDSVDNGNVGGMPGGSEE